MSVKSPQLYTPGQAARKLNMSLAKLRSHISAGLPVHREGGKTRVTIGDAKAWLDSWHRGRLSFDAATDDIGRMMTEDESS